MLSSSRSGLFHRSSRRRTTTNARRRLPLAQRLALSLVVVVLATCALVSEVTTPPVAFAAKATRRAAKDAADSSSSSGPPREEEPAHPPSVFGTSGGSSTRRRGLLRGAGGAPSSISGFGAPARDPAESAPPPLLPKLSCEVFWLAQLLRTQTRTRGGFAVGDDALEYVLNDAHNKKRCQFQFEDSSHTSGQRILAQPELRGRTILFIGDSVIRNQLVALIAHLCSPHLVNNCSKRYFHFYNVDPTYQHSTDFPNGPLQCYLNGTEAVDHAAGGGWFEAPPLSAPTAAQLGIKATTAAAAAVSTSSTSSILGDPSAGGELTTVLTTAPTDPPPPPTPPPTRLPIPPAAPFGNRCQNVSIDDIHIEGVTTNQTSFTRAEKRRDWHRRFPAPIVRARIGSLTMMIVGCHCRESSSIGAVLQNLAAARRRWPRSLARIDAVVASGGLHCAKKALSNFIESMALGVRALRKVTRTIDNRPLEFFYFENPQCFQIRAPTHTNVDCPYLRTAQPWVQKTVRAVDGHMIPTYFATHQHCIFNDHLHPGPLCSAVLSSVTFEALRYVFAHATRVHQNISLVGLGPLAPLAPSSAAEGGPPATRPPTGPSQRSFLLAADAWWQAVDNPLFLAVATLFFVLALVAIRRF